METFKYTLDKSSKKYVCPNCNKKTFVLYIETETGNYLTTDFGRCDREQNCNYHKAPPKGKKYYLINVLSLKDITDKATRIVDLNGTIEIVPKSQILEVSNNYCWISEWFLKNSKIQFLKNEFKYHYSNISNIINEVKEIVQPTIKPSFHSLELLDSLYNDNSKEDNLTKFLSRYFSKDDVFCAKQNYFITGTNYFWNNSTIFWQINNKEQIQGAKVMLYDWFKGKRIKEPYNHINWLHNAIKEPDFTLNQCLFGLHRINEDYNKIIALVESEKTAIIMSILLPQYIWLATGSKSNFKAEMLKPIKKRNVVCYPDKGEYNNWLKKANELNKIGFKIAVSDLIENTISENGFDLADYFLKGFNYI